MRIDVISIFPAYLAPLELSLPGKAQAKGLLEVHVHDLRDWTTDRHHSVDDTPYGGGAGMVMKPEPWGAALDEVRSAGATLIVPTPSGQVMSQQLAAELATREHLVFACGRYEGIDQRVLDEAATSGDVIEVSLGDYVLNGGEVAALAIIESVVRLIPGFMGNSQSLAEESHSGDGLLEYPVYTKPATWRGREVPEVLLSGDHAKIAAWRRQQAVQRTRLRRPELLKAEVLVPGDVDTLITKASEDDIDDFVVLQRACWVEEGMLNDDWEIPAFHETAEDVRTWMGQWHTWVLRADGRLIGGVRARAEGNDWSIGRLMVAPHMRGRGLGKALLGFVEAQAPTNAARHVLFTGKLSERNLAMYAKAGYRNLGEHPVHSKLFLLAKRRKQSGR